MTLRSPCRFFWNEPKRLTDEWSVTSLVRQVGDVLREGGAASGEEKDVPAALEEFTRENLERAEAYAEEGELDEAIAIYERWVELKPDEVKS